ncbi:MAG: DNA adenine methylase [Candidatus Competibacteraceae bacterium]|nr:DNA adenine methylase [Candidatus Competibacteraceae bacterium]
MKSDSTRKALSPLRYPGGKGALAQLLTDVLDMNDLRGCPYYEPYAGGAGAALRLLSEDSVSMLYLNDADRRVYAFWSSVLKDSEAFIEKVQTTPLTIEEWHRQKAICSAPKNYKQLEVGFAAFYMNRCNRSGVLTGAGPIGGLSQQGKWRINVRFNRETLIDRLRYVALRRSQIRVSCLDAIDFLKSNLPRGQARSKSLVYLDPPYVNKGNRLYLNSYSKQDHINLRNYIQRQTTLCWLISYDDTALVRSLYAKYRIFHLPLAYTLQEKRAAHELLIPSTNLALPSFFRKGASSQALRLIDKEVA